MSAVVAIDLGSNTFRAIEYDCRTKTFGRQFERIVKTADRMHETGRIDDGAVERVIDALKAADELFDLKKTPYHAVTTAAMRMAQNSEAVLARIARETGIGFEIIDADREAFYTLTAVRARLTRLGMDTESLCMIDIGGGSTEVIFYENGRSVSKSFPIGIVTVAQQCSDPDEIRTFVQQQLLREVYIFVDTYIVTKGGRPRTFVTTAGTPTTIAAFLQGMTYDSYDPAKINGYRLTKPACEQALQALLKMDEMERTLYVGVGREALIVAGVVIVELFYEVLDYNTSVVIDDGVREGVAIAYCEDRSQPSGG
jgi:exopolyphosphatase / guanosine-5'-triphosphate,3'-diphosphate pyrophosphatase